MAKSRKTSGKAGRTPGKKQAKSAKAVRLAVLATSPTFHDRHTADPERECAALHNRTGRIIKLLTVQETLDEEFVQKM